MVLVDSSVVENVSCYFQLEKDVKGVKVGLVKEGFEACTEEQVKTTVREAAEKLSGVGCSVSEVSVPAHKLGKYFSVTYW